MSQRLVKHKFVRWLFEKIHFRKRLPGDFGRTPIIVTPDARIKFLKPGSGVFEREYGELLDIAREIVKPGDTVWDVGSNVGVFTFAAASRAGTSGHVLSIEPDITLVQLLRRSAQLRDNSMLNVEVLSAAVSDSAGVSAFHIAERGRTANALEGVDRSPGQNKSRERQLVPTVTLDQLLEISGPPDVLKIDVEGAEDLALRGAHQVLKNERPIVYCEVGQTKRESVTQLFREADYVLFNPANPKGHRVIEECIFNTLALPAEQVD